MKQFQVEVRRIPFLNVLAPFLGSCYRNTFSLSRALFRDPWEVSVDAGASERPSTLSSGLCELGPRMTPTPSSMVASKNFAFATKAAEGNHQLVGIANMVILVLGSCRTVGGTSSSMVCFKEFLRMTMEIDLPQGEPLTAR